MGIGDWGLGIGDWGLGSGANHQSPIPNPQSPVHIINKFNFKIKSSLIMNFNYKHKLNKINGN